MVSCGSRSRRPRRREAPAAVKRSTLVSLAGCAAIFLVSSAGAFELPAVCPAAHSTDDTTPISELRRKVQDESETNPTEAVSLMCATIPRVAKQYGEQSPELAWWVESLTMPMIAYMDRFAEALPLLAFAQPILERTYGAAGEQLADIHVAYAWIYQRQGKLTDDNYGRDHHTRCFTTWMAGGGVKAGLVLGKTDDYCYNILEDPVHIHDLQATILHCLGVDHTKLTYKFQGRYFRLTDVAGNVVDKMLV